MNFFIIFHVHRMTTSEMVIEMCLLLSTDGYNYIVDLNYYTQECYNCSIVLTLET